MSFQLGCGSGVRLHSLRLAIRKRVIKLGRGSLYPGRNILGGRLKVAIEKTKLNEPAGAGSFSRGDTTHLRIVIGRIAIGA
jgi:hypothetical protein